MFSSEEKRKVLHYVMENSLNDVLAEDEEKWQRLGDEMNRDWKDIRSAYRQWQTEEGVSTIIIKKEEEVHITDVISLAENYELDIVGRSEDCEDMIRYVQINGQLIDINNLEEFTVNEIEALENAVECDDNQNIVEKRQLDLNDLDLELLKKFEMQSNEELELKRIEHEKKMMIYKMQLEHGAELHKEKMKILKAKLKIVEQRVQHIDHVICNKKLTKRFKSGPI